VSASLAAAAALWLRDREALVSHFLVPSALIGAVLRGRRPHLAIAHGSDGAVFARLPPRLRAWALRGATARWYTHDALRDRVAPEDLEAVVRPMGFHPAPSPPPRTEGPLRVVVVARLVPVKDVARAVVSVARLCEGGVDATLDVLGDGPERPALRSLAARCLGARGRLHGAVDAATRDRLIAAGDVLLHTARSLADGRGEGAPVALLEAMGAGRCVVATDSGGVRGLVGDAGVVLPERASPDEIAAALAALSADRARLIALGRKAMVRVEAWSWARQAREVERLLGG
jgi:glycosyltransferase involved in cell wall biosynthesis